MSGTAIDLKRELPELYKAGPTPTLVDVPELTYLMIDGHGDPNTSPLYAQSIQALFSVAYTVHFALRRRPDGVDASVMPLEGLWWVPDMADFTVEDKTAWDWTMMIRQPREVTPEIVAEACADAARRKPTDAISRVRLEAFAEGLAAQVMHRGPYSAEGPVIEALHRYIAQAGLVLSGRHHEIYLGDPRRSAPERLRTIVRQPVTRKADGAETAVGTSPGRP